MKNLQLLLIVALIGYCFTDTEEVDCQTLFEEQLKEKCDAIDTCSYNSNDPAKYCIEIHDCSVGNGNDANACTQINPPNYATHKCILDGSTCKQTQKQCSDYKTNSIIGNNCRSLAAPNPTDQRCIFSTDISGNEICGAHYKDCSKILTITGTSSTNNECTKNIPEHFSKKCVWTGTTPTCNSVERNCNDGDEYFVDFFGKDKCSQLELNGTEEEKQKKRCIYNNGKCQEEYIQCQDQQGSTGIPCESYTPLKQDNTYDYAKICTEDTSVTTGTKCKERNRKCSEYSVIPEELLNEALCNQLEVTEKDYQKCVYDEKNKKCIEEYNSCEAYITHKIETGRAGCEKIILSDKTKKCVYIPEKDECITKTIYSKCEDYPGKDKKICESILSSETSQYCILDKDSECKEKPINCTDAKNEKDCLNIAKASDSNKRCAYNRTKTPSCYEEYLRCEDYLENSQYYCENSIKLYDGKKCKWESSASGAGSTTTNKCRSQFKTCGDATKKEECKLISKTGVTNPDRKVCDFISTCFENYKYCSDYRGDTDTECEQIKPYDASGDNLDFGYKCSYEANVGCQKVPVECSDAGSNPILCESYSQYIHDKEKKYCVFTKNSDGTKSCKAHYKKCEYIEPDSNKRYHCSENIVEGYIINACENKDGVSTSKCVTKDICSNFISTDDFYKELLCKSVNSFCSYKSGTRRCEYEEEDTCGDIKFYSNKTSNKETCENMQASKTYKKCALKEDESGCEEIYKELDFSTSYNSYSKPPDTSSQGNSSGFITKFIHLMTTLLCLLI
ncbi:MAG: hypothetical protein J6O41_00265 [Clostridia bacterium]|nr:hypothetical protein [Clostridia bacterium]